MRGLSTGMLVAFGMSVAIAWTPGANASVVLSNATTSVVVNGGDVANADPLIDYDGYFRYTDLATGEETTWSVDPVLIGPTGAVTVLSDSAGGGFGAATDAGGSADSSAFVGAVSVSASTVLSGTHAITTFSFESIDTLDGHTFLFYAENDIFGVADDVAEFSGSIAGDDLSLVMFDSTAVSGGAPGLTVYLDATTSSGADLLLFGSGIWTGFGDALKVGDLSVLSSDGSAFVGGPGDLGLALAFSLSGETTEIVIDYYTTPDLPGEELLPAPATAAMALMGLLAMVRRRR